MRPAGVFRERAFCGRDLWSGRGDGTLRANFHEVGFRRERGGFWPVGQDRFRDPGSRSHG